MTSDSKSDTGTGRGAASHAWEVAKEVRVRGEECLAALDAAVEASRILDEHLLHVSKVAAPATSGEAVTITAEWYRVYQTLSGARKRAFVAFEQCAERVLGGKA